MLLVVDSNVVLSALISGKLTNIIFSPKVKLVAPELLFTEIRKHKEEILTKSSLTKIEFEILFTLLEKKIRIIPLKEFIDFLPEAEKLLKEHRKDAPYVALTLKLNCPFWSYEKKFENFGRVESLTTKGVKARLSNH